MSVRQVQRIFFKFLQGSVVCRWDCDVAVLKKRDVQPLNLVLHETI